MEGCTSCELSTAISLVVYQTRDVRGMQAIVDDRAGPSLGRHDFISSRCVFMEECLFYYGGVLGSTG